MSKWPETSEVYLCAKGGLEKDKQGIFKDGNLQLIELSPIMFKNDVLKLVQVKKKIMCTVKNSKDHHIGSSICRTV